EVTRNLKQAKPNELDSHFRGNDGILGFCFWFSVLVLCPCGNDGLRENAVRKVFGRHFLRFSGGGRLRRLVLIFVNPLYIFMRLTY
ncbi:TPA: hypothetical protein ACJ3I1_002079, partial [Neisseria meningitidis]